FEISKLELENTIGFYHQTKPFIETEEDTTSSLMPNIILDELLLKSVQLDYISDPDKMTANLNLGEFTVEFPEANLQEQIVRLESFAISDSKILFHSLATLDTLPAAATTDSDSAPFAWPDWDVEAGEITIANTDIEYKSKDIEIRKGYFNPE